METLLVLLIVTLGVEAIIGVLHYEKTHAPAPAVRDIPAQIKEV